MSYATCTVISDGNPSDPPPPPPTTIKGRSETDVSKKQIKTKFPRSVLKACFGCATNERHSEAAATNNNSIKAIVFLLPLAAAAALWILKFIHVYVIISVSVTFMIISSVCIHNVYKVQKRASGRSNRATYFDKEAEEFLTKATDLIEQEQYKKDLASMLSRAIQIPTISYNPQEDGQRESTSSSSNVSDDESKNPLLSMHQLLRELFPLLHRSFPPVVIQNYSLLYTIPGKSSLKPPIMLCAHIDVVPAPQHDSISTDKWIYDPFSGKVIDGFIWGRGAIDNKHNVISQLAAMELLIQQKVTPPRTVYLALGHDEEIGGNQGAAYIAKYLTEQPNFKQFEFILDEGSMIFKGAIPGFKSHVAMISTAEKGYINVELSVSGPGGHSSMPPIKNEENIVYVLGNAIRKLQTKPPLTHFEKDSGLRLTLQYLASEKTYAPPSFPFNVVFSNLWLFGTFVKRFIVNSSNAVAATVRTTTAISMIKGGTMLNILPQLVQAYVNHRIHPLETIESVLEYDRKVINDSRVQIRLMDGFRRPPSPISPHDSNAFKWIEECVHRIFDRPTTPSLMVAGTDTYHYWDLSPNIYRFSPVELAIEEAKMFHGVNEKISVNALAKMVLFYSTLIVRSS